MQVRYQRDFDLEATGDQALASGKRAVIAALTAHTIAAVAAVAALLAAAWARPRLVPFAAAGFAAVQAAHLAVGIVCLARLPGDGWLAGFPVEYLLVTSWLAIQPFRPAAAMTTAALLVHVVALPAVRPYSTANIRLIRAVGPMALWAGALLLCRAAALDARARFWRAELLAEELSQLRSKLLDLLPAAVARSIALAAAASGGLARLPCESCRAVVLQVTKAALPPPANTVAYVSKVDAQTDSEQTCPVYHGASGGAICCPTGALPARAESCVCLSREVVLNGDDCRSDVGCGSWMWLASPPCPRSVLGPLLSCLPSAAPGL